MTDDTRQFTDTLYGFCRTLMPIYRLLLSTPLPPKVRQSLAANLHPGADRFVRATAEVIQEDGGLFPDLKADPAQLLDLQERAYAVAELRGHLWFMLMLCSDTYFDLQGTAMNGSLAALRRMRQIIAHDASSPDLLRQLRRIVAIEKAEAVAPKKVHLNDKRRGRRRKKSA